MSKSVNGGASGPATVYAPDTGWYSDAAHLNGSGTAMPTTVGTHVFSITCTGPSGTTPVQSIAHTVTASCPMGITQTSTGTCTSPSAPTAGISHQPSVATVTGFPVTIGWSSKNATSCSMSKSVNGGASGPATVYAPDTGWYSDAAHLNGSGTAMPTVVGTHVFSITCTGPSGTTPVQSIAHTVTASCPIATTQTSTGTCTSPSGPTAGISHQPSVATVTGFPVTIGWSSKNATSCSMSKSVNGGASGPATVYAPDTGWYSDAAHLNGSGTAMPTTVGTHVFSITCTGPSGTTPVQSIAHTVTASCPMGITQTSTGTCTSPSAPTITSISPTSAKAGDTITVIGKNLYGGSFSSVPFTLSGGTTGTVNGTAKTVDMSGSYFTFVVPSNFSVGTTYTVAVDSGKSSKTFTVISGTTTVAPPPISNVKAYVSSSPNGPWVQNGSVASNQTLYIKTTGLDKSIPPKACAGNSSACAMVSSFREYTSAEWGTSTTEVITSSAAGVWPIGTYYGYLYYSATGIQQIPGGSFTVTVPTTTIAPTITSLLPASGKIGTMIGIYGSGFTSSNDIYFNWSLIASNVVATNLGLGFTVPSFFANSCPSGYCANSVTPGNYSVQVVNTNGKSNMVTFTVTSGTTSPITPVISSVSPTSVKAGDTITVYGSNLYGNNWTSVPFTLDGAAGTASSVNLYGTSFTFVVPSTMSAGTHTVAVDSGKSSKTFTVTAPISLSPGTTQTASVGNAITSAMGGVSAPTASFSYEWSHDLQIGSPYFEDVKALQMALTFQDLYRDEITGGFYNQTYLAVKAFQQKYGIEATGFVGPMTRSKLNALY